MQIRNLQVRNIPLTEIVPSDLNPRKTFNQEELEELAQSIKENGLIQPITVRKVGSKKDSKYEIVCGERRFRACQLIGVDTIQAVVKELNDKQAFACMIIENLQRKDIDPMEEAAALDRLYHEGSMTVAEMAKMLGKSTSFVSGRIQLLNTIPPFVQLMRDGILVLTHLLDICKLPKEQQEILYESCFTEACRARWTYKFPNMPQLHEMIDENVMNYLSKARFNTADDTFPETPACDKCPLNTVNDPDNARDVNCPRCMNRACFLNKTRISIFRSAKEAAKKGAMLVYAGEYVENEVILKAAEEFGIEVAAVGNRQYVLAPEEPDRAKYNDEETYAKRKANFDKQKAVFDDNISDGTVTPVFEVCYNGHLSGETKYVFNIPDTNDEPFAGDKVAANNERISELKMKLRDADDHYREDLVEQQRVFMESSEYSTLNTELSPVESLVFQALILKRLPVAFKQTIGCDEAAGGDFRSAKKAIAANINAIAREFIRTTLSEKSVNYSPELAEMLSVIMEERYSPSVEEITKTLEARYGQSKANIRSKIEELREENRKESLVVSEPVTEEEETPIPAEANDPAPTNEPAEEGINEANDAGSELPEAPQESAEESTASGDNSAPSGETSEEGNEESK